ncbi:hypothetical protein Tsp_06296 [Trichinella spiralis]|uniref:hypothetical protein n=1 Tax=Trichinella spiralis TaxID=6334 RepID=UPI0001EFBCE0|nr:hypothetical protein Tsp_06296 [Trichinella spiralis]
MKILFHLIASISAGSVTAHCDTSFSRVLASPDTDMGDFLPYPDFSPLLKTIAFIPGFAAVFMSLLIVKGGNPGTVCIIQAAESVGSGSIIRMPVTAYAFRSAAATCSRALPKEFPLFRYSDLPLYINRPIEIPYNGT